MWIAQGYVFSNGESQVLEDIGDEYFNELLWMSVFEEIKGYEGDSSMRWYKMHGTFYNLARFIGKNEIVVLDKRGPGQQHLGQQRHVSIVPRFSNRPNLIPETLSQSKHLRTLLVFSETGIPKTPESVFSCFTFLRELKLSGYHTELPNSIGEMLILRYLDLSNSHFHKLPHSVSSMRSLQVLNLFGCYNLNYLPRVDRITGMRHLDISGCEALIEIPFGIKKLVYLQTLPIYIMPITFTNAWDRIHHLISADNDMMSMGIFELQHLDLRGQLKIKHVERVRDIEEAKSANLMNKPRLKSVGLCWGSEGDDLIMNPSLGAHAARFEEPKPPRPGPSDSKDPKTESSLFDLHYSGEILEGFMPHANLSKLFIVGYPGVRFPLWNLPNLVKVVLINCKGCIHLPSLGHLPLLKSLHMERIREVTSIGQEFYGEDVSVTFPVLEDLYMEDFPNLRNWSSLDGKDAFPKLGKLAIKKCQNLVSIPSFMSLKHLELHECNSALLKCVEESSELSTVVIKGFHELVSLPENFLKDKFNLECLEISSCHKLQFLDSEFSDLTSLWILTIRWCEELSMLPEGFQNLTALESLEVGDCHSLITLVISHLTSLQSLSVETCSSLSSISLGFQRLTSLEHLRLMHCPNLDAFPDHSELLCSLKSLSIISCALIESLPEGLKLASALRSLEIHSCHRFKSLPEWLDSFSCLRSLSLSDCRNLKSLPVALARLHRLQRLCIENCPDVYIRCHPERGEDWWKIAHIPHRRILSSQHP